MKFVRPASVKALAHEKGRRVSAEFVVLLDDFIREKIQAACAIHNGGRITLDADIFALAFRPGQRGRS